MNPAQTEQPKPKPARQNFMIQADFCKALGVTYSSLNSIRRTFKELPEMVPFYDEETQKPRKGCSIEAGQAWLKEYHDSAEGRKREKGTISPDLAAAFLRQKPTVPRLRR
ncbi:MAG: hypothetical protein ACXWTP_03325 [Methylosarcina sp.]